MCSKVGVEEAQVNVKRKGLDSCLPPAYFVLLLLLGLWVLSGCDGTGPDGSQATPTLEVIDTEMVALGKATAQKYGCLGCHSIDGLPGYGPTWKGLYGSQLTFTDGTNMVVDEKLIRESIRDPLGKVVEGFPPLMPSQLLNSDEEIDAIIAYIKSLR